MTTTLPAWATHQDTPGRKRPSIFVDGHAAYTAILDDYRERYQEGPPPSFVHESEWEALHADLDSAEPSAYWLEVAYQSIKLDLQFALKTHALTIYITNAHGHRQTDRKPGRRMHPKRANKIGVEATGEKHVEVGPHAAAGGHGGGREAREHYRTLRGFIPNFG